MIVEEYQVELLRTLINTIDRDLLDGKSSDLEVLKNLVSLVDGMDLEKTVEQAEYADSILEDMKDIYYKLDDFDTGVHLVKQSYTAINQFAVGLQALGFKLNPVHKEIIENLEKGLEQIEGSYDSIEFNSNRHI